MMYGVNSSFHNAQSRGLKCQHFPGDNANNTILMAADYIGAAEIAVSVTPAKFYCGFVHSHRVKITRSITDCNRTLA
ncbi:hypothetical protein Plhal304r1_c033g0104001 [Plasmopara halstedii]